MNTTLIERVKQLFTPSFDSHAAVSDGPLTIASDREDDHAERISRLIGQISEDGTLVAGCVQLLGLDAIRARFGSQWDKIADRARQIVEQVLNAELSPGDVYRPMGDSAFQICFETSDEAVAKAQVERICSAVVKTIAAELSGAREDLSVDTFVASVPGAALRNTKDPMSALHATLLEVRRAAELQEQKRHSIPALRNAGVLFQPLWANRDFGDTQNRCMLDTLAGAAAARHLEAIDNIDDLIEALANLDCVLFTKSVEGLHRALGEVKRATIVIPVHYQTLAAGHAEFLELAATLPNAYRRFVLLDLIGVPLSATRSELSRVLATARNLADRVVLQLPPSDHRMDKAMMGRLWGVSMSFGDLDSDDPVVARDLARFALLSAEAGLFSFAYGANTIGKATVAASAGFDYIGGTAVHTTVPTPRPHGRFTPLFGENAEPSRPDVEARRRSHPRYAPLNPNSTITLPDGSRKACRVLNFSASGAAVSSPTTLPVGSYLALGSIPAQVVRQAQGSFAVRFLELQQLSVVEAALSTTAVGESLLFNLRALGR